LTILRELGEFPGNELPDRCHIVDALVGAFGVVLDEPGIDLLLNDFDGLREINPPSEQAFLLKCPVKALGHRVLLRRMRVGEELHDVLSLVVLDACPQILRSVVVDFLLDRFSENFSKRLVTGNRQRGDEMFSDDDHGKL